MEYLECPLAKPQSTQSFCLVLDPNPHFSPIFTELLMVIWAAFESQLGDRKPKV